MKPFTKSHGVYEQLYLIEDTDGSSTGYKGGIVAISKGRVEQKGEGAFTPFTAFARETVAAPLFDLLHSAPLMYQALTKQYVALQGLLDLMELGGMPASHPVALCMDEMQKSILLTQQAAREGILPTSLVIDREERMNKK